MASKDQKFAIVQTDNAGAYSPNYLEKLHSGFEVDGPATMNCEPETAQNQQLSTTSSFFRLPRELRDQIYDYAFGEIGTKFRTRNMYILARRESREMRQGLPNWLRTNKQICYEALAFFGSTHVFTDEPLYEEWTDEPPYEEWTSSADSDLTTPLVFNKDIIRNVGWSHTYFQPGDPFLVLLRQLDVTVSTLHLEWFPYMGYWNTSSIDDQIAEWAAVHLHSREGSLRKVKIDVIVCEHPWDAEGDTFMSSVKVGENHHVVLELSGR
ncbi:hypothetical protein TUN199_07720, partial [Pyrenophora tritici-repentis]